MIHTLDLEFMGQSTVIAAFLLELPEGPILVETGPHSTLPALESALGQYGLRLRDIRHVLLTHIHLDHAGAAWALAEHGATIYMHPLGRRHMVDPSKLLASASRIYGNQMNTLWGTLRPIPDTQVICPGHSERLKIAGGWIQAWHTPGHAIHHIAWQWGDQVFVGDVGGVRIGSGPVMPPCPPPDINIEDWRASLGLLGGLGASSFHLTHFGEVTDTAAHLAALHQELEAWTNWMHPHFQKGTAVEDLRQPFMDFIKQRLQQAGADEQTQLQYELANPGWMSIAGLLRYWKKKKERQA